MDPFERGLLGIIHQIKDAVVDSINKEKNPYPTIALEGAPARMPFGVLESDDAIYEINGIVVEFARDGNFPLAYGNIPSRSRGSKCTGKRE